MKAGNGARLLFCAVGVAMLLLFALPMGAQNTKPNIVVIFGDDIGYWNIGAYTHGMMGRTPSIDSIAKNGMLFTDHYGQPITDSQVVLLVGLPSSWANFPFAPE